MTWRLHAACLGEDAELFYPTGTTGSALNQIARAKAVCSNCLVRLQCLDWALETRQDNGVWGGASEDERRDLRRTRRSR